MCTFLDFMLDLLNQNQRQPGMCVLHVLQAFLGNTKFEVQAEDRRSRASGLEKRAAWGRPRLCRHEAQACSIRQTGVNP